MYKNNIKYYIKINVNIYINKLIYLNRQKVTK